MRKIKVFVSMLVCCLLIFGNNTICNAQENSEYNIGEESNYTEDYLKTSMINRAASAYVKGGDYWGIIYGDNNFFGETIRVYNCSGKDIKFRAYNENGTLRASGTIKPGEFGRAGFWAADGTYYFRVQFSDQSEGTITIRMETEWL